MEKPMIRLLPSLVIVAALMNGQLALADDAAFASSATDALALHDPIHWVSVDQIEKSLEGKPPMTVGFDIDDTVLFSSPCFFYG
jgi:acid phosphatase (class B)